MLISDILSVFFFQIGYCLRIFQNVRLLKFGKLLVYSPLQCEKFIYENDYGQTDVAQSISFFILSSFVYTICLYLSRLFKAVTNNRYANKDILPLGKI